MAARGRHQRGSASGVEVLQRIVPADGPTARLGTDRDSAGTAGCSSTLCQAHRLYPAEPADRLGADAAAGVGDADVAERLGATLPMGSFSEASAAFDPETLRAVIAELSWRAAADIQRPAAGGIEAPGHAGRRHGVGGVAQAGGNDLQTGHRDGRSMHGWPAARGAAGDRRPGAGPLGRTSARNGTPRTVSPAPAPGTGRCYADRLRLYHDVSCSTISNALPPPVKRLPRAGQPGARQVIRRTPAVARIPAAAGVVRDGPVAISVNGTEPRTTCCGWSRSNPPVSIPTLARGNDRKQRQGPDRRPTCWMSRRS